MVSASVSATVCAWRQISRNCARRALPRTVVTAARAARASLWVMIRASTRASSSPATLPGVPHIVDRGVIDVQEAGDGVT